ncbi:TetR/AcrR family transcriptional regulator [Nocardia africana]|uniref:Bacterial regulatory proteins, tetR family n=1 Tax=Nocardia africana TaxID=134964 RepID=A0A378X152_9NOCA|nr:helix-turn-helix domain-containing protein [Nocardia africana]MCC3312288.1 TetR/AcrR family transcriptional regulator [Nocardia africana]SUA46404.1 Bacterial regulatory proteins, tetR family [Nocardia africana]
MTARVYGGVAEEDRRSDRRKRLIDSAYNLLAAGGPEAVTVTGVCREAGLSPRYFYENFDNRDALVQAILDAEADAVISFILERALSTPGGANERGHAAMDALLDALETDPRRAALGKATGHDDLLLRFRATVTKRMAAELATQLLDVPGFEDRRPDLHVASTLIMFGILQLVIDWLGGETTMSRQELVEVSVEFAIATLTHLLGRAE